MSRSGNQTRGHFERLIHDACQPSMGWRRNGPTEEEITRSQEAIEQLKAETGCDFGQDYQRWQDWLDVNHPLPLIERVAIWCIEKIFFCDSGSTAQRIVLALVLGLSGLALLYGLYHWSAVAAGWPRGLLAWFIIVVFFSKAVNLFECGGCIPTSIWGAIAVLLMEAVSAYHHRPFR